MSRNGTPMQRLRDRQRVSLSPERKAAIAERRLELQAEGAVETVLGNRPFEIVNVEGTDVAPFLGKTDGDKLVEASGLDDGVVQTPAIAVHAIRPSFPETNAAAVSVLGLNDVGGNVNAAGASTVVTLDFDLTETTDVTVRFACSFGFTNAETCELALFMDYAGVHSMQAIRNVGASNVDRYREIVQHDPAGGPASAAITTVITLAAGSHTAKVLAMTKLDSAEAIIPAGSAVIEVALR